MIENRDAYIRAELEQNRAILWAYEHREEEGAVFAFAQTIGRTGARILANRRLMRVPLWLYRARLGFLFGSRMLMLEHIGRASGCWRQVVLEVISHPGPRVYLVASGFGERAQWFRNVMASPEVRISVAGHGPRPATARRLSPGEADAVLRDYQRRHPRAWARFKNVLDHTLGTPVTVRDTALPIVELQLTADAAGQV